MDLLKERARIIVEHEAMERYHPYWRELAEKGDRISERPIAFVCDDEVVVVGDDVQRVYDGLQAFADRAAEYVHRRKVDGLLNAALNRVTKTLDADVPNEIRVSTQVWNSYLYALDLVETPIVLADGSGED